MAAKENIRPGGRSARVQASIHAAVKQLLAEAGREALTIPLIAARAGVTPSTIYRRWGDLANLLADVAVERLRPDGDPGETGALRSDLEGWLEQYVDEMSSGPGRAMTRMLASGELAGAGSECAAFTRGQLAVICDRARARGERFRRGRRPDGRSYRADHVSHPVRRLADGPALWRAWLDGALDAPRPANHDAADIPSPGVGNVARLRRHALVRGNLTMIFVPLLVFLALVVFLAGFRVAQQYQRGVVLRFGR